ncbi:MAG: putative LPS assembly protein LptD [Candidatus Omnitrophica bacterium]|nr:putative LPS assembly protein LptD [Candidatus Omnitrophota bacterium]
MSGIVINGDDVEFSTDSKEFSAKGNVVVLYKGAKLSCDKLVVNTDTKDGVAEGHVRLDDKGGVIEGDKMSYNFEEKKGILYNGGFRSTPYFGRADEMEKVNENEFVAKRGYFSTCSYDNPHWRMKSRKIKMFPGSKIMTKDDTVYFGTVPAAYMPEYNHNLGDPLMNVQLMPGHRKDWGYFMLTTYRYKLSDYVNSSIYADYRANYGLAEGLGLNYIPPGFGKGDFKFYYTHEKDSTLQKGDEPPPEFQRYFVRNRYKWDIDPQTNFVSEYYKIVDSKRFNVPPVPASGGNATINFLKDYFPREYEKDAQPNTYALLHHGFEYGGVDVLFQPRINPWYTMTEKKPEITYTLSSLQLGETPFYWGNTSILSNLNYRTAAPSAPDSDINLTRFDMSNRFSLPAKVAFFSVTPFVANREVFDNTWADGSYAMNRPQTVFSSGADVSTKFYRLFDVNSGILGMDINGLRHVITPSVGYAYQHDPTVPSSKLKFGGASPVSNVASLSLDNKLQTKRAGKKVDLVDFLVTNSYNFKTGGTNKASGTLSDFLYTLDVLPYSWMSMHTKATFSRSGGKQDPNFNHLSQIDFDLGISLTQDRNFSISQRFLRKGGNQMIYTFNYRLNPKWKFYCYERFEMGQDAGIKRGLREQGYTLSRDLHCWIMDTTYNVNQVTGNMIMFAFHLKAFPEMGFNLDQSYHAPKPGSQS